MARSTYIYIVTEAYCEVPLACFTVKHELQGWWNARTAYKRSQLAAWRFRDGGSTDHAEMALNETGGIK